VPTQPIPTQGRLDQRLSDHRQAWVEAAPLLFGGACAPLATAVEDMAELVALTTPLRRFEASSPDGRLFYRACTEVVGNLAITHAVHTGIVAGLAESAEAMVHLSLAGNGVDYRIEGRRWRLLPGRRGLYLPGLAVEARCGLSCGLAYNLDPGLLARHICFLSPRRPALEAVMASLQRPLAINLDDPRVGLGWRRLRRLLPLLGRSLPAQAAGPLGDPLQDRLYAATAWLVRPDLMG